MKALIHDLLASYPRGLLCIALLLVAVVACLNPPHDNEYDPDNKLKAHLSGTVYGPDDIIPGAIVHMIPDYDTTDVCIDTTDANGKYSFEELDPGIYKIFTKAEYHYPQECYPESLKADTAAVIDVFMHWLFTFDNESIGTIEPFNFEVFYGDWGVVEDQSAPSLPNVYSCATMDDGFAALIGNFSNFCFGADFKVIGPDTLWNVGFILRYVDSQNYYSLSVSAGVMHLEKWENGTPTVIGFSSMTINTDEWYNLDVDACGSNFYVYLDGDSKIEATDSTFTEGRNGLYIAKGANASSTVHFDNVTFD
ncbi:MAG TPA: carboxypeptidase-like regulatory domain-containing protein [bacterium]|jgi:hypothetical protein